MFRKEIKKGKKHLRETVPMFALITDDMDIGHQLETYHRNNAEELERRIKKHPSYSFIEELVNHGEFESAVRYLQGLIKGMSNWPAKDVALSSEYPKGEAPTMTIVDNVCGYYLAWKCLQNGKKTKR